MVASGGGGEWVGPVPKLRGLPSCCRWLAVLVLRFVLVVAGVVGVGGVCLVSFSFFLSFSLVVVIVIYFFTYIVIVIVVIIVITVVIVDTIVVLVK